jgi:Condensation domain
VLRSVFRSVEGRPAQIIKPAAPRILPVVDLTLIRKGQVDSEVRRLIQDESLRPFNLAEGPLMRAALIKIAEDEQIAFLTMHHIVSDGWSTQVLIRELSALYQAFSKGKPSPLPDLPIQYADFAHWQRSWLQGDVMDAHLEYWSNQLAGSSFTLDLPTQKQRPEVQTFRGAEQSCFIADGPSERLKALSREEGCTLFMTVLAAFQSLLYRYTGQSDIIVGSGIANRNYSEIEGLIGFFVNMLAMRADLSGNPTFREAMGRVRETALGAYLHQDMPFEKLVEELQPQRDASRTPIFQVAFFLQNGVHKTPELGDVTLRPLGGQNTTSKFDLTLYVTDMDQGMSVTVEYNTDLFAEGFITQMLEHFDALVDQVSAHPDQRLSNLRILSEAETDGFTASDFPDADLSQEDFEKLVLEISGV